ncbi:hypothetical protein BH09VER1_BH09VER1_17130 [soil metagenome]
MREPRMIVHMIGNAHLDPVWLWSWQAGLDEALASFRSAADRCDEYPDFIYTRGEAWLYHQVEEIDPALFARIVALVRQGRWHITGGQWVQPDTNLPTGEGLRRQALRGQRYFRDRFGVSSRTGYNVDTFGHPSTLPDLLAPLGYRGYVFHRPAPEQVPLPAQTFRWRGPLGGELIGFRIAPCYVTRSPDLYGQIMLSVEAADQALGHTMCFYGVGNHGGGPTKANIEYILQCAHSLPGIELRFSDPETFFDAVESAPLPTVDWELQKTFPGCYSVMHDIKQQQRRSEHLLSQAARVIETFPTPAAERETIRLDRAWDDLLFTQFHDILAGTSIDSAWPSVRAMQGRAFIEGEEIIARVTRRWARAHLPSVNQQQIALLNPHPFPWHGWVEWEPFLDFDLWRDRWLSHLDGTALAYQEIQPESQLSHFHRLLFPVTIPAQGSTLLLVRDDARPAPIAPPTSPHVSPILLANDQIAITLADFGLSSLRYKGRELLGPAGLSLTLREDRTDTWTFLFDRYEGPILHTLQGAAWRVIESGPLRARVCLEGKIGQSSVRWLLSLYHDEPRLQMSLEINFAEQYSLLQLPMSLALPPLDWLDGQPGGSVARSPGPVEWPVQNWSCLRWDDLAAAWISGDAYSISCQPDRWQWSLLRSPRMAWDGHGADIYQGRDIFTDQGIHRFDFTLLLGPDLSEDVIATAATRLLQPPIVFDRYEGMDRPAWGNNPPQRLWTGAEQRAAQG